MHSTFKIKDHMETRDRASEKVILSFAIKETRLY